MTNKKGEFSKSINIKNRKASFEFYFIETYSAGIALMGTEIKSIRQSKASLQEAYCYFKDGELFIKGMNIAHYERGTFSNHDPLRERKLLLKKRELSKLEEALQDKGLTIIPVRLFTTDRGFAKLEIALAKGKKLYDKRESIKEKDTKKELARLRF
jgi:SsrA-binding protein